MLNKSKLLRIYLAAYILLLPIIRYYKLPGGNNLYLFFANICALVILLQKRKLHINYKIVTLFGTFFLWILIISIYAYNLSDYSSMVQNAAPHNLIVLCDSIILAIICFEDGMDYRLLVSMYKYLCYFLLLYICFQFVGIKIPGLTMTGRISILEVADSYLNRGANFGVYPMGGYIRYSSLFIEPSHFAQYLAPFLCMNLYGYEDIIKKNFILSIIISLLMVMSISGTSIAIAMVIWGYYFFRELKSLTPSKMIIILLAVLLAIVLIWVALQQAGIIAMLERMTNVNDNKVTDRVTRGFAVFLELPILEKLFGIGYQCVYPLSIKYGIEVGYQVTNNVREYVNDISSLLLSFGMVGFGPIVYLGIRAFKGSNKAELLMYISCLSIFISECTFGVTWLMLINMCIASYKTRGIKNKQAGVPYDGI
ncbi:hypothetical protein [Butyrivibrio sp. WCD3002]|uniref:hypothetical protein n=1 Tax=Butyrivibrio sp. WCD3002 TaxID=1280676 RepID=UPI00042141C5|nr:hypothetical protein [Butyrivibrio sp. WCD3002]